MEPNAHIGQVAARVRREAGFRTLEAFAAAAAAEGVQIPSTSQLSRLERGRSAWSTDHMKAYAAVCSVPGGWRGFMLAVGMAPEAA